MHLVFAGTITALLAAAILSGAHGFGLRFRRYSMATVIVMLVFFAITLLDAPNVAANRPTPYMGLTERVSIGAWLIWIVVFSVRLQVAGPPVRSQLEI